MGRLTKGEIKYDKDKASSRFCRPIGTIAVTIIPYYCTLRVPLINPSHNVQKGDIYPVPGLLAG
jgi:hypothetical protein